MQECLAGAEGIKLRYGDFEIRFARLSKRSYRTPISLAFISLSEHSNLKNRTEFAQSKAPERNEPFGEE